MTMADRLYEAARLFDEIERENTQLRSGYSALLDLGETILKDLANIATSHPGNDVHGRIANYSYKLESFREIQ